MKYNEAQKLKQGDKIVEKTLGNRYIMTVKSIEETKEFDGWTEKKYVIIDCIAENGYLIKVQHRNVSLLE